MPMLRLLYCDSAGIRRCRVVVGSDGVRTGGAQPQQHNPADKGTACGQPAAGQPPAAAPSSSLKTVGEDSLLSPQGSAQQVEQQQQQHDGETAASGGMKHSASMLLAAGSGAVSHGAEESAAFHLYTDSSRESSPSRASNVCQPAQQQQQQQQQLQPAATLHKSPSEVWAVGAGVLPASGGSGVAGALRAPAACRPSAAQLQCASSSPFAAGGGGQVPGAAAQYAVGLTKACMSHPCFADMVAEGSGLSPVGEVLLVPDLAAAVAVPWCPAGSGMAPVDMLEKGGQGEPWACCPRSALKRALARLEAQHGLTALVGFELEFLLLKPAPQELLSGPGAAAAAAGSAHVLRGADGRAWVPWDDTVYCQASSIDSAMAVLSDMVANLQALGIGVQQFHAEAAPGQFEVALSPYKLLFAREAITAVARQRGLAVSFLPKPLPNAAGSGCHMHISLQRLGHGSVQAGASIMAAAAAGEPPAAGVPAGCHGLSCAGEAFLGGVLARLPGLLPFLLPSANSYARLQPCCWSGAFLCWGYENREAPLRVCCPAGGPGGVNIEVKCVDGTTNPYIGLAALLAAGMQGLDAPDAAALPPPVHADPSAGDGGSGGATPRQPLQRLPASLGAALQELEGDARVQGVVQEVLGPELVTAYLAVRRAEAAATVPPDALLLRY